MESLANFALLKLLSSFPQMILLPTTFTVTFSAVLTLQSKRNLLHKTGVILLHPDQQLPGIHCLHKISREEMYLPKT